MAITTTIIPAANPTTLIGLVNAVLATMLTSCVRSLELLVPGDPRYTSGGEWQVALTTQDGFKSGNAFQVNFFAQPSTSAAAAAAQAFITAHPTYFFSPVTVVNLSEGSRSATKAVAVLVYNTVMSDGVAKYGIKADGVTAGNFSGYYTQAAGTGPTNVTGLAFDTAIYRGMIIDYVITQGATRKTTTGCVVCGDAAASTITDPATTVVGVPGVGALTVATVAGIAQVQMTVGAVPADAVFMRWTARRLLLP